MKRILTKVIGKSEFSKNALTLTFGTSLSQAFPLIFYPILSRIFTPGDFGLLATVSSITTILAVLGTGKYEFSILLARTKKDAANIVGFTVLLGILVIMILFVILQIFSYQLGDMLNEPRLQKWLFICPISAFGIIIYNCYNEWCIRHKYFSILSWNKMNNSLANVLSKLLFGIIKTASGGLILGELLGRVISAANCVILAFRKDRLVFTQISFLRMKQLARRFIEFPKYYLPSEFLMTIGVAFPVYLIGALFNNTEVGYYAMTMNIISLPIIVISTAVRDVFRQRANEEYIKHGRFNVLFVKLFKLLMFWGVVGNVAIIFFLPSIFSFVLGEEWILAGQYSQILLPMISVRFICTSFGGVLVIVEKMRVEFLWRLIYIALIVGSLILGGVVFHDMKICLFCFSIGGSIAYMIYIYLAYKYSKGSLLLDKGR